MAITQITAIYTRELIVFFLDERARQQITRLQKYNKLFGIGSNPIYRIFFYFNP